MLKWDVVAGVLGVAAVGGLLLVAGSAGEIYTGVFVVLATVGTFMTLNHTISRRPDLRVEYRNPDAQNRAVINGRFTMFVVLVNDGAGPAEAMEVRFDDLKAKVYNERATPPIASISTCKWIPLASTGGIESLRLERRWFCVASAITDRGRGIGPTLCHRRLTGRRALEG